MLSHDREGEKRGTDEDLDNSRNARVGAALIGLLLAGVMGYSLWDGFGKQEFGDLLVQRTAEVSDSIFSTYLLPFEILSLLLLVAMVGVILLSKKDLK